MKDLKPKDRDALDWLRAKGGQVLISTVPDRDEYDVIGGWLPGLARFKRLEKRYHVYITEEEPIVLDEGDILELTPSLVLV